MLSKAGFLLEQKFEAIGCSILGLRKFRTQAHKQIKDLES